MQAFFGVAYFLMGVVQFFAIWDFLSGGDGGFLSFLGAMFLAGIPIVGSAMGGAFEDMANLVSLVIRSSEKTESNLPIRPKIPETIGRGTRGPIARQVSAK